MIEIRTNSNFIFEKEYIYSILLKDFLGIDYTLIVCEENKNTELLFLRTGCKIIVFDVLFTTLPNQWLHADSLPKTPLKQCNLQKLPNYNTSEFNELPVIFGVELTDDGFFIQRDNEIKIGIDIFGASFFMLSRYEEYVLNCCDQYDRFIGQESLAFKENFLHRPIINEYVELLYYFIIQADPSVRRKKRRFEFRVSHDVDHPHKFLYQPLLINTKRFVGDIIKWRSPVTSLFEYIKLTTTKVGVNLLDPYYTFPFLMDSNEKAGIKGAFYFMTSQTNKEFDGQYNIQDSRIQKLMKEIYGRGHEIGLHPSFDTYKDKEQTKKEFTNLLSVCERLNIKQDEWGGRQHYLKWSPYNTFKNWEYSGLQYDSTLSFAQIPGFRCGTCYEYQVYDLEQRRPLALNEIPLIVMEVTLFHPLYLNLGADLEKAYDIINSLKNTCKRYNGIFTLLWHNSFFPEKKYFELYKSVLK